MFYDIKKLPDGHVTIAITERKAKYRVHLKDGKFKDYSYYKYAFKRALKEYGLEFIINKGDKFIEIV